MTSSRDGRASVTPDHPDEAAERSRVVVAALTAAGETLAVAESLTGGLLGAAVTDARGASLVFRGGITAYATELKHDLLGVDGDLLSARGPVDPDVAAQMAAGVRARLGATHGLATTGVAGPDPQGGKPPGTVCVAWAGAAGEVEVRVLDLPGDRAEIRTRTVAAALDLLLDKLALAREHPA